MSALPKPYYTVEDYVELLKNSEERFEYFEGQIVAMAGGKLSHSIIAVNTASALQTRLTSCRVFNGDAAVKVPTARPFRLPDVSVACGELRTEDFQGIEMLVNPILIVEVLSSTTAQYDREGKFLAYQSIESFQEYLLIEQERPHVTQYIKQPNGFWLRRDYIGIESEIELSAVACTLTLAEIYRDITFES
ncbi:MAG: Uma2 family endonuclease [Acidobacteria bacterium]|nr:Uma2 family endonuclease [Acidobacteriota bacterium]